MAEEQNSIDEFFRQSLGDYREVPPAAAWDDIERKLDKDGGAQQPRKRKYFMNWPWIALLLLMLVGGTWLVSTRVINKEQPEKTAVAAPADSSKHALLTPADTTISSQDMAALDTAVEVNHTDEKGVNSFSRKHVGTYAAKPLEGGHRRRHRAVSTGSGRESKKHAGATGVKTGNRSRPNRSITRTTDKTKKEAEDQDLSGSANSPVNNDVARQDASSSTTRQQRNKPTKRPKRNNNNAVTSSAPNPAVTEGPDSQTAEHAASPASRKRATQKNKTVNRSANKPVPVAVNSNINPAQQREKGIKQQQPNRNVSSGAKTTTQPSVTRTGKKEANKPETTTNPATQVTSNASTKPGKKRKDAPQAPVENKARPDETAGVVKKETNEQPAGTGSNSKPVAVKSTSAKKKPQDPVTAAGQPSKPVPANAAATAGNQEKQPEPAAPTEAKKPVLDNSANTGESSLPPEKAVTNKKRRKREERAAAELARKALTLAPTEEGAKRSLTVTAPEEDEDTDTIEETASGRGHGSAASGVPSMRQFTLPPVSISLMAGYEWNLQQPAPNRINTILQFLFHVNESLGIGIQPAYRFGDMPVRTLTRGSAYYNPYAPRVDSSSILIDTILGIRRYTYYIDQSYDSIITPSATAGGRIWDITLPVIFHYKAPLSRWHFYGGPSFTFGGKMRSTVSGTPQTFTGRLRDSLITTTLRPISSFADYFGVATRPQYSNYNAAETQAGDLAAIRIGYIAGLGYEVRNFLLDVSIQQQLTGYSQINSAVRNAYSSPSFRISIGYRIFSNSASLKGPSGRNFMQRL